MNIRISGIISSAMNAPPDILSNIVFEWVNLASIRSTTESC